MAQARTVFLGVDPGTNVTGFGVISVHNNTVVWEDCGVIAMPARADLSEKLACIFDGLLERIQRHRPAWVSIEQAFYAKNARTALVLGHARGVALLAAAKAGARVVEYTPREIKKALVGNGNATKEQVSYMVAMLLGSRAQHPMADASDALAAALCAYYHCGAALHRALQAK